MKRKLHTTFAAIHLGSEMISMQIVEYRNIDRCKVIEQCNRPIRLGEETFKNKVIPYALVNEICDILYGFKQLMVEYEVEEYKLQATTAVREAENQIFLLDQIYSKTGLMVDVVDMPQEIYTKYTAIRNTLKQEKIADDQKGMLMMDISSGGLGITLVKNDAIAYQQNFHVGIIRIKESYSRNRREDMHFNNALNEMLSSTIGPVRRALQNEKVRFLVLSGTETEMLLKMMKLDVNQKVHRLKADLVSEFFNKVRRMNLAKIISEYNIPESAAELVLPTVILYELLMDLIPADEVVFTSDRFIDGMQLLHIGGKTDVALQKAWEQEFISLFHSIGAHFNYDKKHVSQVERLSLLIFDKVAKNYGMGAHERLLLRGAALLHDLGKYLSMRSHSLYTYQLIMATDILGFSDRDKQIMALAAYYHANKLFDHSNKRAPQVEKSMMAVVAKLAAIIRVADAMDRSYKQKIKSCNVIVSEKTMLIRAECKSDLTLELWSFADKSSFFEEVYGLQPMLERVGTK